VIRVWDSGGVLSLGFGEVVEEVIELLLEGGTAHGEKAITLGVRLARSVGGLGFRLQELYGRLWKTGNSKNKGEIQGSLRCAAR